MVIPIWLPTHIIEETCPLESVNSAYSADRDALIGERVTLLNEGATPYIVTDVKGNYYRIHKEGTLQLLTPDTMIWDDGFDKERRLPREHPSHWYKSRATGGRGGRENVDPRPIAPTHREVPVALNFRPSEEAHEADKIQRDGGDDTNNGDGMNEDGDAAVGGVAGIRERLRLRPRKEGAESSEGSTLRLGGDDEEDTEGEGDDLDDEDDDDTYALPQDSILVDIPPPLVITRIDDSLECDTRDPDVVRAVLSDVQSEDDDDDRDEVCPPSAACPGGSDIDVNTEPILTE